ncbi:MAG: translation initiation factor IF-2 N-terminal domain-containing protein, partial [Candidatus Sulfotelmatobacter sp.]
MSKVRINDLARELEVKSKAILDALQHVGVTEKKTHSSSLEDHEAEKVRAYIRGSAEAQGTSARNARPLRGEEEIKTKIDLSHISRPGDVLRAITQKKEAAAAPPPKPVTPPVVAKPVAAPPLAPPRPAAPPVAPPVPAAAPVPPAPPVRTVVAPPVAEKPAAPIAPAAPPVAAPPRPAAPPTPAVVTPSAAGIP